MGFICQVRHWRVIEPTGYALTRSSPGQRINKFFEGMQNSMADKVVPAFFVHIDDMFICGVQARRPREVFHIGN